VHTAHLVFEFSPSITVGLRAVVVLFLAFILATSGLSVAKAQTAGLTKVLSIGNSDGPFFEITEVAIGPSGAIFVSDKKGFSIYKYSAAGELLAEYNARGSGPGEFEQGPAHMSVIGDNLVVAESLSRRAHVFGLDLVYRHFLGLPPLHDMASTPKGVLLIASPIAGPSPGDFLAEFDLTGQRLSHFPIEGLSPHPIENLLRILVTDDDYRIVVFLIRNRIDVYDPEVKIQTSFSIPGVPEQYPSSSVSISQRGDQTIVPGGVVFANAALSDNGLIFLQERGKSGEPISTTVHVVNQSGIVHGALQVPAGHRLMNVGGGLLYTRADHRSVLNVFEIDISQMPR